MNGNVGRPSWQAPPLAPLIPYPTEPNFYPPQYASAVRPLKENGIPTDTPTSSRYLFPSPNPKANPNRLADMPPMSAYGHSDMPPPSAYGHYDMPPPSAYGHYGMPPVSPFDQAGMPPASVYGAQHPLMPNQNDRSNMLLTSGVWNGKHGGDVWKGNDGPAGAPPSSGNLVNQDIGITSIQHNLSGIEPLTESNYAKWRSQIDIILGHLEYDVALLEPKPDEPVDTVSDSVKEKYRKWNKANRMCILIIRGSLSEGIRDELPETDSAKELMCSIQTHFRRTTKCSIGTMISQLCVLKFDGQGSVREHILQMEKLACRLRDLKVEINDDFLVHMVLKSLPTAFDTVKIRYYSTEEKWTVNELLGHCIQEEAKDGQEKDHSLAMETLGRTRMDVNEKTNDDRTGKKHQGEKIVLSNSDRKGKKVLDHRIVRCYHCGEAGHSKKRHCAKKKKNVLDHQIDACNYCHEAGHFKKECPRLNKKQNREDERNGKVIEPTC